jgi:hypothetical protein
MKRQNHLTHDGLLDYKGPIGNQYLLMGINPVNTGLFREGVAWPEKQVNLYMIAYGWACSTEQAFMNIIETLNTQYDDAKSLWEKYEDLLKSFRANVKNDISSIESSARKTTDAVHKMKTAYGDVISQLNSEEMINAINNATNLATAMATLANLQSHALAVQIVNKDKQTS